MRILEGVPWGGASNDSEVDDDDSFRLFRWLLLLKTYRKTSIRLTSILLPLHGVLDLVQYKIKERRRPQLPRRAVSSVPERSAAV